MSVRRAVALALSATLAITGLAAATPAAVAATDTPYEVAIDAPPSSTPPTLDFYGAGTGLQTYDAVKGKLRWQRLSDGSVAHHPTCDSNNRIAAHGDKIGCGGEFGNPEVTVHDYATGTTVARTLPPGHSWLRAFGQDRLLSFTTDADAALTLHLLGTGQDTPQDTVVRTTENISGYHPEAMAFDDAGAVVRYEVGSVRTIGLVDFATGELVRLPAIPGAPYRTKAALSADWIVLYDASGEEALLVSRTKADDPGRLVKLPKYSSEEAWLAVLGDWIVGHYGAQYTANPIKVTSLTSGDTRDLAVRAGLDAAIRTGTDGNLYVVGGADSSHWGVRRISLDTAAGGPVTKQVLSTPPNPLQRAGLTLAHGRVTTEHTDGYVKLQGYDLSLTEPRTASPAWGCTVSGDAPNCPPHPDSALFAARWADTGDGRLVTLGRADSFDGRFGPCIGCLTTAQVSSTGPGATTHTVTLESTRKLKPQRFFSASGRYVHFLATENSEVRSVVADIEAGKVLHVSENTNEALWGGRLWVPSTTDDTVSVIDLRTGASVEAFDLGTDCRAYGFGVVGKWIYSLCPDGTSATVYDREKKTSVDLQVPRSTRPQLGDGFLVHSASADGTLTVTDVRSGTPVVRTLGAVASELPNYGQGWVVDRFGGAVAYIDKQRTIRVVGLGGATSALTAADTDAPAAVDLKAGAWKPRWWLSKPAGSWSLTLKRKTNGAVVRTLSGGQTRGVLAPVWDGKDEAGKTVANDTYTWTLTVAPADGHGAAFTATGALALTGGVSAWRDMAGADGFGDLLVMDSAGLVSLYRGNGSGGLAARTNGTGAKFPSTAVLVPSGDVSGDGCNDVYGRVGDELRSYRPGCGQIVSASSPYTVLGKGWGQYDVLTSSGDVNGDGFKDLIARQTSTGDMYFYPGTADHRLGARVKIGTNWKLYGKIVGAGDLNGDGRGDLLGMDASGVLWRYYGTANGGVTARVKVGAGWGAYNALVGVGDLTGDGRGELLARDTTGKLWRYTNQGNGLYAGRVMIGTAGWNAFKGLY